jgi:uncharacterized delta-60 repeat protein
MSKPTAGAPTRATTALPTRGPAALVASVLAAGLALAGSAQAAPGRPALAPGRVVFPVDGGVTSANADGGRATQVVSLPDGGAVLIGGGAPARKGFYAAELTPTGALDPSFGSRGIARLTVGSHLTPVELLRQDDGKLVVVASTGPAKQLVVLRINADGGLDQTFGSGGVATSPIAAACDACTPAALAPDGDIVLTGENLDPGGSPSPTWALTRLTPSGALDQTFGHVGIETIPGTDSGGYDVAVLADDDIITLGLTNLSAGKASIAMLTRVTPMGLSEPDFDGGVPAELPPGSGASAIYVYPDESVLVGGTTAVFRFTSVGNPDTTFANAGIARVGSLPSPLELLPAANGAVLAVGPTNGSPNSLTALRIAADGSVDPALGGPTGALYQPPFGGGRSSFVSSTRPRPLPPLAQDSFLDAAVAARPDGSYLAVGGVAVSQPTGDGGGRSIFDFAAAALTPSFTPDTGFGGPAERLTMKLTVSRQTARTAVSKHGIAVRIDLSAPGLARVRIKAHGTLVAQSVLPIFGSGARTLPVELTSGGAAVLRAHPGVRVTASASARGLLTATTHASASGTLH